MLDNVVVRFVYVNTTFNPRGNIEIVQLEIEYASEAPNIV